MKIIFFSSRFGTSYPQFAKIIPWNSSIGQKFKYLCSAKKSPDIAVKYRHYFSEWKSWKIEQNIVTLSNVHKITLKFKKLNVLL